MENCKALKAIDPEKSPRPDSLEPSLLKVAADYIAEAIAHISNQNLQTNFFSKQRKAAYVLLLLLKSGDPPYRLHTTPPPLISTLPVHERVLKYKINS